METKLISGTLEMMVLEIVSTSPSYGYQITQTVLERSEGYFELKEGSLYPALYRMEREKMLSAYWVNSEEGRRRKYYKLTAKGKKVLATRRQEWKAFAAGVNGVLGEASRAMA